MHRLGMAIAVTAWLGVGPVFAAGPAYEIDKSFSVSVDGDAVEGARVFRGNGAGKLLLVVPSESKRFLVDPLAGSVFALREEDVTIASDGATAKVREHFAWSVPLSRDRDSSRFLLGSSEVAIQQVEPKPAAKAEAATPAAPAPAGANPSPTRDRQAPGTPDAGAPGIAGAPAPANSGRKSGSSHGSAGAANGATGRKPARECVSLQTRPVKTVPACSQFVFLVNTCDAPVVAQLQRTEHLMTGTLPQQFTETVAAGSELALGCSWWSGAMAPADHLIVGASYLQ